MNKSRSTQDKTLEELSAKLGELIIERAHGECTIGKDTQRMTELDKMIELQKKLGLSILNRMKRNFCHICSENHARKKTTN